MGDELFVCKKRVNNDGGSCVHFIPPDDKREAGFCTLQGQFRCVDNLLAAIPRLSHSSIQDWLKCRRLFYLKNIRGITRRPNQCSNAIKMGSLWDACQGKLFGFHGDEEILQVINMYEIEEQEREVVRAVVRAFRTLDLSVQKEDCTLQERFTFSSKFKNLYSWIERDTFEFLITGVYDRKYPKYFVENKFSGAPDYYQDVYWLSSQVGTYFLSDPAMEYCVMEIIRTPSLRKREDEPAEAFGARIYADILARPGWYFIGYNKKTNSYGRRFYRNEFRLDELSLRYQNIGYEIMDANERDAFYRSEPMCRHPWECDMLDICKSGVMSEELYTFKTKRLKEISDGLDEIGESL